VGCTTILPPFRFRLLVVAIFLLAAPAAAQLTAERIASGLSTPIYATSTGDPNDPRLFIVEQGGRVKIHDGVSVLGAPFIDLNASIIFGGEQGLLGLAFAPDYATSGHLYVNYTRSGDGATIIERYTVSGNPNLADAGSGQTMLTVSQPFANHNGGQIAFGPDGFLYVGMGDGGAAGDPQDNAQNTGNLLGAILRLDTSTVPASVAAGNPFGNEIWAYGLRNPYRFSFDRSTGDLWTADVGENTVEEVNLQRASSLGGENYGWRCYEGSNAFDLANCPAPASLTFPVMEYLHTDFTGILAVIGGYRYRGPVSELEGLYFFADHGGLVFAAAEGAPDMFSFGPVVVTPNIGSVDQVAGFGEDSDGDVYLIDIDGEVFRLTGINVACPTVPLSAALCATPAKSILILKDKDGDGPGPKDKVVWRWLKGPETEQADFGDPTTSSPHALCLYTGGGTALAMEILVPAGGVCAGKPCWKTIKAGGFGGYKYLDRDHTYDGIRVLLLKGGAAGKSKVILVGKDGNLPMPSFPLDQAADVIVQLVNPLTGGCWAQSFAPTAIIKNTNEFFKAKSP
jgi:glucose/arabinose dehydrogenase